MDASVAAAEISTERARIEAAVESLTRREISFENARAQIKQKWKKMDAYLEGDQVVRIRTYPQGESARTEEFYFKDGKLILAFIEDDGLSNEGQSEARKGKTYWFSGGKFIKEENDTGEAETTAPSDDAQRLMQEAQEYLVLASKQP